MRVGLITFLIACNLGSTVSVALGDQAAWNRYFDVKRVGTELMGAPKSAEGETNLFICEFWSETLGTDYISAPRDINFLNVAGAIVEWRELLRGWGPEEVWKPRLIKAEEALFDRALRNSREDLMGDVDNEGRALARDLNKTAIRHKVNHQSECGAGGYVDVNFRTEPGNGLVTLISEFDYELCRLKGIQNDHERCPAWRVAKQPESVSGVYYIQVNWPKRVEGPRRYDLNPWSGNVKKIYLLSFQ